MCGMNLNWQLRRCSGEHVVERLALAEAAIEEFEQSGGPGASATSDRYWQSITRLKTRNPNCRGRRAMAPGPPVSEQLGISPRLGSGDCTTVRVVQNGLRAAKCRGRHGCSRSHAELCSGTAAVRRVVVQQDPRAYRARVSRLGGPWRCRASSNSNQVGLGSRLPRVCADRLCCRSNVDPVDPTRISTRSSLAFSHAPLDYSASSRTFAGTILSTPADLGAVVAAIALERNGADCTVVASEQPAHVLFPQRALTQLAHHLVENGMKHREPSKDPPIVRLQIQSHAGDSRTLLRVGYERTQPGPARHEHGGLSERQWGGTVRAFGGELRFIEPESGETFALELAFAPTRGAK